MKITNSLPVPKVLGLLIAITFFAWSLLIYQHWQMSTLAMSKMWMPPNLAWQWQNIDFVIVYLMWAVMMAAMMLPSALPMIQAFSMACQQHYGSDTPFSYLFSFAYLLVWFIFSIALTLLQWQLHSLQWLSGMMGHANTPLAAVILIIAGIYQFTTLKNACLIHCRSPFSFLLNSWKNGKQGAFNMGIIHGSTCLGCCWAQLLLMFAVGVMNITGMILITLFILLEKSLPVNELLISRVAGGLLMTWGVLLILL